MATVVESARKAADIILASPAALRALGAMLTESFIVSGVVSDAQTGTPIARASVSIRNPNPVSVSTDASGVFSISPFPAESGTYQITAAASNYISETKSILVSRPTSVPFALNPGFEERWQGSVATVNRRTTYDRDRFFCLPPGVHFTQVLVQRLENFTVELKVVGTQVTALLRFDRQCQISADPCIQQPGCQTGPIGPGLVLTGSRTLADSDVEIVATNRFDGPPRYDTTLRGIGTITGFFNGLPTTMALQVTHTQVQHGFSNDQSPDIRVVRTIQTPIQLRRQ